MIAGGLITIGVMEMLTQRAIINPNRVNWTKDEATLLGLTRLIQGLGGGIYALVGTLTLIAKVVPIRGAGHWVTPVGALLFMWVVLGTIGSQGLIAAHNGRLWPFRRPAPA